MNDQLSRHRHIEKCESDTTAQRLRSADMVLSSVFLAHGPTILTQLAKLVLRVRPDCLKDVRGKERACIDCRP